MLLHWSAQITVRFAFGAPMINMIHHFQIINTLLPTHSTARQHIQIKAYKNYCIQKRNHTPMHVYIYVYNNNNTGEARKKWGKGQMQERQHNTRRNATTTLRGKGSTQNELKWNGIFRNKYVCSVSSVSVREQIKLMKWNLMRTMDDGEGVKNNENGGGRNSSAALLAIMCIFKHILI